MPQWPWRTKRSNVDEYGRSSLWHHAAEGNIAPLENELHDGSSDNVSAADKDGFTALHVAAQNGHLQIVRRLVTAGADVNVIDRYGNGPLWTACRQASLAIATEPAFEIVGLLLRSGANPHHVNNAGRSPVVWAIRNSKLREIYIGAGVPVPPGED
ncbi:ankyrin repeat domain-containing protein [Brucella anthropi]|uniref:ankyrin repeat domain-containing protein n=1 Tax=Brucella anthropi TaxID=529 RepID=UPI001F2142C6|nr:ankyrin repeat domain-containing protein [Brucella anthropi]